MTNELNVHLSFQPCAHVHGAGNVLFERVTPGVTTPTLPI